MTESRCWIEFSLCVGARCKEFELLKSTRVFTFVQYYGQSFPYKYLGNSSSYDSLKAGQLFRDPCFKFWDVQTPYRLDHSHLSRVNGDYENDIESNPTWAQFSRERLLTLRETWKIIAAERILKQVESDVSKGNDTRTKKVEETD